MSQQSLLRLSGVPAENSAIPGWATRIRDRVRVIAKNISVLEVERQHLLSMLWDAGLGDLELSQAEDQSGRRSVASVPLSIIDLVSEESFPPTPVLDSPVGSMEPRFSDVGLENDGGIANISARDSRFKNEIEDINPRELSFELPTEAQSVAPMKGETRVFKPEEWTMIDFSKMDLEKLKLCMSTFGLKTSGGKAHMINHLKHIFQYACGDSVATEPPSTIAGSKEQMFEQFSGLIQDNHELYERIILFESVELSDVHAYLQTKRKEEWQHFSLNCVREFLDSVGVQYSNTSGNEQRGKRRRKVILTDDNRRILRKSISCP